MIRGSISEVWAVDFEFRSDPGERPEPHCMVAHEIGSGRSLRLFAEDLRALKSAPFATGPSSLMVAFYASAEVGCFLALGWEPPDNLVDLFAEFRVKTNGLELPMGRGLLGALHAFGIPSIEAVEKEEMRALAMRGGPFTGEERRALLDYCESDVVATAKLFRAMVEEIDFPRALLRGRAMIAAARMEWAGVPIDVPALEKLRAGWDGIREGLIRRVDSGFGVYEGTTFKADRFASWLNDRGIAWPRTEVGSLALDDDSFRQMAKAHPEVSPLRELRSSLGQMRLADLAVGSDGRNRVLLSAFSSRTGRFQPSNSRFIFGPSVWLRGLVKPEPGRAVAYVDFSQQEFGIAAAFSGDRKMAEAYRSGDPYMTFAIQAGAAPPGATKETHGSVRSQFKTCALGVLYGLGEESLALKLNAPKAKAVELLRAHHETYRDFWKWSDQVVDLAMLESKIATVYGWQMKVEPRVDKWSPKEPRVNAKSLRNWPMQAHGSEILRLSTILATERGVTVCAPVHDAVLIEAPVDEIDAAVETTQRAMLDAGRYVLGGFDLASDAKVVRFPDRYMDEDRGLAMWQAVWAELGGLP